MESADELLKTGDLAGVRAALVQRVREKPDDVSARMFLFQLFLVAGEWDKAEAQLRALAQLTPETQMLATVCGQAIAAEKARAAAFAGQGAFPVLVPSPWLETLAQSLGAFAVGDTAGGEALRDEAYGAVTAFQGSWNGTPFGQLADCDARFGPSLEAIINGNWGLLPLDEVAKITSEGPRDLRDTIWLPVEFTFRSGASGNGFLMARYPGSEAAADDALRLARATAWQDGPAGQEGIGQRLLFGDGEDEFDILSLRALVMD